MSQPDKTLHEVATLLSQCLEGDIQADQYDYFKTLLRQDPRARAYYYRLLAMHATLQESESIFALQDEFAETPYNREVWDALSIDERTAPAIDVPPAKPAPEIIQKVSRDKTPYKLNRSSLLTLIFSAAAIVLIVLFLHFGPNPSVHVATLTSSIDAVFAGNKTFSAGSRLSNHTDSLWLQKGVIKIEFDYGAKVVIEAPAEFQLDSAEDMTLYSGRLYAHVPDRSKGFTVETPNSRVIDLGTEFAVKVDYDGTSDVHMMKGKASLIPGVKGQTGQGQILTVGQAFHVNSRGAIETIAFQETEFVRDIFPDRKIAWRGQRLDLADIVGGGNGLGTGRTGHAIDPLTGTIEEWRLPAERYGNGGYVSVPGSVFIDGVFVPDGGNGPIQVTSAGHRWVCPDTSSGFKYNIVNSLRIPENRDQYDYADYPELSVHEDRILTKASEGEVPVRLMGLMAVQTPPDPTDSSLFIHANQGITFDLSEIRKLLPAVRITKFTSLFGVGELSTAPMALDLWILVDGQPRLIRQNADITTVIPIDIELSPSDRFLTLIVTEGGGFSYAFDWGLFMNPRLDIE